MDKFFKLKERGTNIRTEVVAGLTTFFAMAYIIFVNPRILSSTGMNWGGVFVATILAAVIGTVLIGLLANIPYVMAPGMGVNAFFTYTVCLQLGFVWQEALAMVFICGLMGIIITATRIRAAIIVSVPTTLRNAIGAGIGVFIAYIGLKSGGVLQFTGTGDGWTAGSDAIPSLVNFSDKGTIVTLLGLAITVILMARKVKGALLLSIITTTMIALPFGVTSLPEKVFDISVIGDIRHVAFKFFGNPGFGSLFSEPSRIFMVMATMIAFMLTDMFDTIGTFLGTGMRTGIFTEQDFEKMKKGKGFSTPIEKGLFSDVTATMLGSILGTSTVTTYVESAVGIGEGGRTGLTSIVSAIAFLLCLPFASLIGIVPAQATAPILVVAGVLMVGSVSRINWDNFEEALPAFLTLIIMPLAYSITSGIAAGFISYCLIKIVCGKFKEVHPVMYIVTVFFILNFALTAIGA